MQPAEVLVKATGLSLGYTQRTVLHDINLEVQSGEFWFCLGLNGAGKTTLLRALLGAHRPQTGQLWLHPHLAGRQRVGFVPQQCALNPTLGYPLSPGQPALSMTCHEGLTTLPGHGQRVDL
jgi:ABC-type Mn2+/Zn2+ transport system ATPase subunit